jgi:hypothetical protein
MDLSQGIVSLSGIRELAKLKKEGMNIDGIDWKPMIENYLYCKAESIAKTKQRLQELESDFSEALKIKEALENGKDC